MHTLLIHHDECLRHDPDPRYPESPARQRAVLEALRGLRGVEELPAPLATREQVTRVHPEDWFESLQETDPGDDYIALAPDSFLGKHSLAASLRAAGGPCFAVDQVITGQARNAFCAVRPPGHHAESTAAMGFCILNGVAIAARHAQATHGIGRVTILDFDVHHGNGTQAIFETDGSVQYLSSHQSPLYPGTGMADERGVGNVLNMPLPPGTEGSAFRTAWERQGLPALHDFRPELIILSAGFDAHAADPLAQMMLEEPDFAWLTREIVQFAEESCDGRVVSVLEGGYNLEALARSAKAHVEEMGGTRVA